MRLALLVVLMFAGTASWAVAAEQSCDDLPACRKLSDEGLEHFGAGRYGEAQQRFAQAYALRPDPSLLYNLGRALHKAGNPEQAALYYQRFLDAGAAGNDAQRRKAEQYLAQAQREAAAPSATPSPQLLTAAPGVTPPASTEPSSRVPLYRRPWLWAVVGVAVAGIAVGLGVGLAARRPNLDPPTLSAEPFPNNNM